MPPLDLGTLAVQEAIVANFASLLEEGSSSSQDAKVRGNSVSVQKRSSTLRDFENCLSSTVSNHDIVCTLPSLDIASASPENENPELQSCPLPEIGKHHVGIQKRLHPEMKASVLDEKISCGKEPHQASSNAEQSAARNLGNMTSWTKSTLPYAAAATSSNALASFQSLVDSRLRAWTLLLLRQSLTSGDKTSRERLMSMLSSKVEMISDFTKFRTLALPEDARAQRKESDVVLPLLFEAVLHVSSHLENKEVVTFRAPGTISGDFSKLSEPGTAGLVMVKIRLDTAKLLETMVEQARLVVFRAVVRVTAVEQARDSSLPPSMKTVQTGFSSALSLTADAAASSPRLQKAQASAARLNSILQSKSNQSASNVFSPPRKNRSVKFDTLLGSSTQGSSSNSAFSKDVVGTKNADGPSSHDVSRSRTAEAQARLRSYKSFGRPHGGGSEGNGPKNATFNDFGRTGGPTWSRSGRLLNHPVPGGGMTSRLSSLAEPPSEVSNQNATFTVSKEGARTSLVGGLSNANLRRSRVGGRSDQGDGQSATLQPSPTVLEGWLVQKAMR